MATDNKVLKVGVQLFLDPNSTRQINVQLQRTLQQLPKSQSTATGGGPLGMLSNPKPVLRDFNKEFRESTRQAVGDLSVLDKSLVSLAERLKAVTRESKGMLDFKTMSGQVWPNTRTGQGTSSSQSAFARRGWNVGWDGGKAGWGVPLEPGGMGDYRGPGGPGGGGGGGPGGGGRGGGSSAEDIGKEVGKQLSTIALGQMAVHAGQQLAGTMQNFKTMDVGIEAQKIQATAGRFTSQALTGISADMFFMRHMRGTDGKGVAEQMSTDGDWSGQKAAMARRGLGIAGQVVGGAVQGAGQGAKGVAAGAMFGAIGGAGEAAALYNGAAGLDEIHAIMGGLDAAQASSPNIMAAMEQIQAEKHMRANAARHLGNHELTAAGMGSDFGRGEAMSIAMGMQRLTGLDLGTDNGKALLGGTFRMRRGGIEGGEGALASITGAMGEGSGAKAMNAIEEAVSRGATKGFTNHRVREELVSAMGSAAQKASLTDGEGLQRLMSILTGGASGPVSVREAQARRGALGDMDARMQNPFFQEVGLANAKGIMGNGASSAGIMTMGAATTSELAVGGDAFDRLGITSQQRREQILRNERANIAATAPTMGFGTDIEGLLKDQAKLASMYYLTNGRDDKKAQAQAAMVADLANMDSRATDKDLQDAFGRFGGTGAAAVSAESQMRATLDSLSAVIVKLNDVAALKEEMAKLQAEEKRRSTAGEGGVRDGQAESSALYVTLANKTAAARPPQPAATPPKDPMKSANEGLNLSNPGWKGKRDSAGFPVSD